MLEKKLNSLLANYEVMLHKLQTFHWYVQGRTFYSDHLQLEAYYNEVAEAIDGIAEKILMIGGKPLATCKDYLATAKIEEASSEHLASGEAYARVRADFEVLYEAVTDVRKQAEKDENFLISAFADTLIEQLSKNLWMLDQALA